MIFGSKTQRAAPKPAGRTRETATKNARPSVDAMKRAISDHETDNPMIRAVVTSQDLTANALGWLQDDRGVRVESVLAGLGALAGFCAVYDVARRVAEGSLRVEMRDVAIVNTADGARYWLGDAINAHLTGNIHSVWSLASSMAEKLGAAALPDFDEIVQRVAGSLGTKRFGVTDLPSEYMPADNVQNLARDMFLETRQVLQTYDLPRGQWPLAVALSIQDIMETARDRLDPALMARIVMEMAIPASTLDPETVLEETAAV